MKVLLVHNKYKIAGGEDTVFEAEKNMLSNNNITVSELVISNNDISSIWDKIKSSLSLNYSTKSKALMKERIKLERPDVIHVHNFFPMLTPSIFEACNEEGVPVVHTLHNYRLICPTALLMFDGQICEKSIKGSTYWAVPYKVYKNSYIGTFVLARMIQKHKDKGTWNNKVNMFIALTDFAKNKFIEAGFNKDKIVVKPNFTKDPFTKEYKDNPKRSGALFVGRLSPEKGIFTLLKAWTNINYDLSVVGNGNLTFDNNLNNQRVKMLGAKSSAEVQTYMHNSSFLVMPSEWYEGLPMVIIEAFSNGLPVLTSRLGGMQEIVEDGKTGLLFEAGNSNDLNEKIQWLIANPEKRIEMGLRARMCYENTYTSRNNSKQLISIYKNLIK